MKQIMIIILINSSLLSMEETNQKTENIEQISIEKSIKINHNDNEGNKCSKCCYLFKECCCCGCCGAIFGLCFIYHCFKAAADNHK